METTIIIPVKDGLPYTKACLKSIKNHTTAPHKIIIVDDGSGPETQDFLKKQERIEVMRNKKSQGFPFSCNLAASKVKSDFFIIMNNDVEVTKNWLTMMLDVMRRNPKMGILGPTTNNVSGPQRDCCAHYTTLAGLERYAETIRNRKPPRLQYFPRIVFYCVLIRKAVYDKIGDLDLNFGLGNYEDDDYCLRALSSGWNCAIDHHVFVHHYGSKTFGKMGKGFADLLEKNKKYFMKKWGANKL